VSPTERLAACAEGREPRLVARLPSGFVVLFPYQFWPGYCLLMADPIAANLNALPEAGRASFLRDMALVGDALLAETGTVRVNYSIYGNQDPFLHAHIIPRSAQESQEFATLPPFSVPGAVREAPEHAYSAARHGELHERLRARLK